MKKTNCLNAVSQLHNAGFESYVASNEVEIFVATRGSNFYGECIDLFNDGTFDHYTQFKGRELKFKFDTH